MSSYLSMLSMPSMRPSAGRHEPGRRGCPGLFNDKDALRERIVPSGQRGSTTQLMAGQNPTGVRHTGGAGCAPERPPVRGPEHIASTRREQL